MYSFLKAFLVLMKLLSLSQFYAPMFYSSMVCEIIYENLKAPHICD